MTKSSFTNPYIVGNPIKTKEMFFGREDDFSFISRKLQAEKPNQVIVLCGERRSGKTSILFQVLNGRLGDTFLPMMVDMQILAGIGSDEDFFKAILTAGMEQLKSDGKEFRSLLTLTTSAQEKLTEFIRLLNQLYPAKVVLILLDEYELLETKIKESILSEDIVHFFSGLLEGKERISFIFTGSTNLENRKVDFWKALLGKSIYRKISYLSSYDTKRLITEPLAKIVSYPPAMVDAIYRLSGGHPFYTQVICQNLVDIYIAEERFEPQNPDLEKVVKDIVENPLPQMIYSWNNLSDWSKFALAALAGALDNPQEEKASPEVFHYLKKNKILLPFKKERLNVFLEEAYHKEFLLKDEKDSYSFRMDLFRRWIKKEHSLWKVIKEVNLDVKRQRLILRYLLVTLTTLGLVSGVSFFIISQFLKESNSNFLKDRNNINLFQKGDSEKPLSITGIKIKSNQGPFLVIINNQLKLTSEGSAEPKELVLPAVEPGLTNFRFINSITKEELAQDVLISAETKELSVNFTRKPEEFLFGALFINSKPEGAEVFLDAKRLGVTPLAIAKLKVGSYQISLNKEGFKSLSFKAEVQKEKQVEYHKLLEPAFGRLILNIRPTAKIYLDNEFLIETPIVKPLEIQAGRHRLRILNENLSVDEYLDIEIQEDESFTIERNYK